MGNVTPNAEPGRRSSETCAHHRPMVLSEAEDRI